MQRGTSSRSPPRPLPHFHSRAFGECESEPGKSRQRSHTSGSLASSWRLRNTKARRTVKAARTTEDGRQSHAYRLHRSAGDPGRTQLLLPLTCRQDLR
ncbi:hypothetical protein GN956_G7780 [Arapaima gigas]